MLGRMLIGESAAGRGDTVRVHIRAAIAAGGALALASTAAMGAGPPRVVQSRSAASAVALGPEREDLGLRGQSTSVKASVTRARDALRADLGRGAVVATDDRTGGLKVLQRLGGFLSGASQRDGAEVALGYVRSHQAAFGMSDSDLDALVLVRDYTSTDGVRHLQWAQRVDGFTVVDRDLRANVTEDGRLINVGGGATGGLQLHRVAPSISATQAYARTLRSVASRAPVPAVRRARDGRLRTTTFAGEGRAQLVAYSAGSGVRLAWRVLAPVGRDGDYDALVDAGTGRLVRRVNLVRFATAL